MSLLEIELSETKISALSWAEKEHDLAFATQEESLLFSICIHTHTINMETMKQLFF